MMIGFMNKLFIGGLLMFHTYILFYVNQNNMIVNAKNNNGVTSSISTDFLSKQSIKDNELSKCPIKLFKSFFHSSLLMKSLLIPKFSSLTTSLSSQYKGVVKKSLSDLNKDQYILGHVQQDYSRFSSDFSLYAKTETIPTLSSSSQTMISDTDSKLKSKSIEVSIESSSSSVVVTNKKVKKEKKRSADALEVIVIGLSHHNAKVEVREKLAIPEEFWNEASTDLCEYDSISEASVLSTCNRFEIYLAGKNQYECMKDAIDYLYKRANGTLDIQTLRKSVFMLSGEDAIWHLLRVSAGLDSIVVGEGQILAQVKRAYEHGIDETGQGGKVISRMLNTAVSAGKRVRSETGISKGAVSISSAAAEFTATKIESDCGVKNMEDTKITIIGAGKMARLLLVHLQTQGVKKLTIVNRSKERVIELQQEFPDLEIELKVMDDLLNVIKDSDVVYPSTASTTTIIDVEPLRNALIGRNRPGGILFVDISVPRNVDPDCASIPNVHCYNVDDLKAVVQRNTAKRRREMLEAEFILKEEQDKFRLWQQSLGAIPTIAKLQEKAENLRQEEMSKAAKKLSTLSEKDLETVEKVTKGIVAKLLHGPMNHLRQQKEGDATRAAILQVQQAFQLEDQ